MTITIHNRWILLALTVVLAALVWVIYSRPESVFGGSFPGSVATIATTSTLQLNPNVAVPVFGDYNSNRTWNAYATSTCTGRIISTEGVAIRLRFGDGATATPSAGFVQAASTTVSYEAEVYGCGRFTIYPMASSGQTATVTVAEFR